MILIGQNVNFYKSQLKN